MSILNYEEMTLESDTFQASAETFNLMLQKLFKKMEQSDMDEEYRPQNQHRTE